MLRISNARMTVWLYRVLMGTLNHKKESALVEILNAKQADSSLEPLERRIWAAYRLHPHNESARRTYLKKELAAWEKRTQI